MQKLRHLESVRRPWDQGDGRFILEGCCVHCSVHIKFSNQHHRDQTMLTHNCADLHDSALDSSSPIRGTQQRGSVNGRNGSVGHQELLGKGELIADAFVDMIRSRDHLILVGIVVQAVEESVKRRRMELSAA
eukprot:4662288-Pleurochrysis_carterae.AAC.3